MPYPNDNKLNIVLSQTSGSVDNTGKFPFTERIISGSNLFILTDADGNLTGSTSIPGGSFTNLFVTALTASFISSSNSIIANDLTTVGNTILGISNDISSTYLIVPREADGYDAIKQPLDGTFGIGFKFDTHSIGGQVNYMDAGNKFKTGRVGDESHVVLPSASGLIYWSNTFAINNFIDLSKVKFLQRLTKNVSGAQRTDEAFGSLT